MQEIGKFSRQDSELNKYVLGVKTQTKAEKEMVRQELEPSSSGTLTSRVQRSQGELDNSIIMLEEKLKKEKQGTSLEKKYMLGQ